MPYYPPKPRYRGYYTKKGKGGLPRYKKPTVHASSVLQAAVRRALAQRMNKVIETKRGCQTSTDGVEIFHNNFVTLNSTMLATSNGPNDPTLTSTDNRIGDEIQLRGVSIKFMVELNERYSDVTFRLIILKAAKSDVPTRATLFTGLSGNKMIDTLNTERYTILHVKTFKIKAPNDGNANTVNAAGFSDSDTGNRLSRATKIIKVWLPGKKFVRSGIIKYEGQGNNSQPKFFDYHCLLYAYSNYSTLQDIYYVGRVNDYVQTIYYKDA